MITPYQNPVTNRCYYVENTDALIYTAAQLSCGTGYLFPIGTPFELSMAAAWTGNIRNYWLFGSKNVGSWETQNSQVISNAFWCTSNLKSNLKFLNK